MLRRLTFRTSPRCKFQKKTSTSPSPKPNADSLPHRLPAEVIYRIIDRHLFVCHGRDLDTLKALALTCKSLRSHCLQYLFASIAIRKYPCACCGNPEGLENPSGQGRDALEFAGIVKQSPEIASVVRSLCIEALPRQRTRNILLNTGKSSDSAKAFTFIINRLTNLEDLEAEALQCKWEDIDTAVQAALTRTLQSDTLKTVSLSMIDIPAVVLSECTSVEWMTIRAAVWDDGRVLQDGRRLPRPRILELDSTCTDSVQPLLNALDLTAVTTLDLGTIDLYNAEYDRLVKACWASLTKLTFTAQGWLDQLEQHCLQLCQVPLLQEIEIFIQPKDLTNTLFWIDSSLNSRHSPDCGSLSDVYIHCLPDEYTWSRHQEYWKTCSLIQERHWPSTRAIKIHGFSHRKHARLPTWVTKRSLGLFGDEHVKEQVSSGNA
ncbi:hypothetical protein CC1G_02335 [Coprinopsis cinerea okayama7|uniref:F-box domain-containing protein n=1 Tax=Coprinopsis cinerea (strain Okayama-7 / 130 / ATCC MYA-4618 / FGSC 9003) TaxID=240176 RepID=A8N7S8_COPC7|nr:hypothetical protein CC1G_02335 [Coprinopsis cinerea okayama7\|eukprot:XP_001830884.2 hypothetical protein CC1G_02335 [Coprinopsis cinerea okayama7\